MSGISINIEGEKEFKKAIDKYIRENGDAEIVQSLDKHALLIQSEAKKRAAVNTGRMRRSIAWERVGRLTRNIGTNVIYAKFVEFGTRFMNAQPFLFPAYERFRKPFLKDLRRILNKVK